MSENDKKFCVVILSHGRAKTMTTDKVLRDQGYTGRIIILIDDEDDSADEYHEKFGDDVKIFSKEAAEEITDTADLVEHRKAVVFARNAVFDVVEAAGYHYFLVLDDDYVDFSSRLDGDLMYVSTDLKLKNLDRYFEIILNYYKSIPAETIALAQGGDYIGGSSNQLLKTAGTKRKVMNSFFCSINRRFKFFGRINEDVNYYVHDGRMGRLSFQLNYLYLNQGQTQANPGGLTDIYKALGTYVKSFYSVMYAPSCVKISMMGRTDKRLHHKIDWKRTAPKIISERHRR